MAKHVWSKERGIRKIKASCTEEQLADYMARYPGSKIVKPPSIRMLEKWSFDCGCKAIDGCWVEPDGTCEHGYPSWLLAMGMI